MEWYWTSEDYAEGQMWAFRVSECIFLHFRDEQLVVQLILKLREFASKCILWLAPVTSPSMGRKGL